MVLVDQLTVTATEAEGMPFATTTKVLAPVSIPEGASTSVNDPKADKLPQTTK
jgi:hypothetical protein